MFQQERDMVFSLGLACSNCKRLSWQKAGQTVEKSFAVVKAWKNKGMNSSLAGIKRQELSDLSNVSQMEHTHSDDVVDMEV